MSKRVCVWPLVFLAMAVFCQAGLARSVADRGFHGHGHDALHHWYLTLRDWQGRPCCNGQDCRPTQSRYLDKGLEVLVDGEWVQVPAHKVLPQSSPDLRTHVCSPGPQSNYPRGFIFCVVLGPGV
ncbi:MAG: hypothetical protein ACR2PI_01275 [Hyphomicrobiaceae bacterium]